MIQKSKFQNISMFQQPELTLLVNEQPVEEEQKISMSPASQPFSIGSPSLSKKMSRKMSTQTPKSRRIKASEISNPNQKFGHWALQENKRYHWFLEIHNHHFLNKHMRRMDKIFKSMAIFVGTREAQQCRSHHQKMEKKYNSICKILLNLRKQHYQSGNEDYLVEDLHRNNVEIIDAILTTPFLVNNSHNETILFQLDEEGPVEISQEDENVQPTFQEEIKENEAEDDGLKLLPLNPEYYGMDIVDELFGEVAPHCNFEMI